MSSTDKSKVASPTTTKKSGSLTASSVARKSKTIKPEILEVGGVVLTVGKDGGVTKEYTSRAGNRIGEKSTSSKQRQELYVKGMRVSVIGVSVSPKGSVVFKKRQDGTVFKELKDSYGNKRTEVIDYRNIDSALTPDVVTPKLRDAVALAVGDALRQEFDQQGGWIALDEVLKNIRSASFEEMVRLERDGVPYKAVESLVSEAKISESELLNIIGMSHSEYLKKMRDKSFFSGSPGQSIIGILKLINTVELMIECQGSDIDASFDAVKWVGTWLKRPQPSLGGRTPAELMDTPTGRESVQRLLGSIQSGAYQ